MTAIPSNWYTEFFNEDYPRIYRDRLSQDATERETEFVVRALGLRKGEPRARSRLWARASRRGAGPSRDGRHGTGPERRLPTNGRRGRCTVRAGIEIETIHSDMRAIPFTDEFDAVINMFTAFGYFDSED